MSVSSFRLSLEKQNQDNDLYDSTTARGKDFPRAHTGRFSGINFHILNFPLYHSCLYLRPHARTKSSVFLFLTSSSECPMNDLKQIKTHLLSIPNLWWYIILKGEASGVPNSRQYKLPSFSCLASSPLKCQRIHCP